MGVVWGRSITSISVTIALARTHTNRSCKSIEPRSTLIVLRVAARPFQQATNAAAATSHLRVNVPSKNIPVGRPETHVLNNMEASEREEAQ